MGSGFNPQQGPEICPFSEAFSDSGSKPASWVSEAPFLGVKFLVGEFDWSLP